MSTIGYEQISEARKFLSKYLSPTRLQAAPSVSRVASSDVALKLESEQPTGSFKVRGALYALAVNLQRGKIAEVVTASTGNHGAAVAYAASLLRVPCTVFLPVKPNPTKRSRIVELGASVKEAGQDLSEAAAHRRWARRTGRCILSERRNGPRPPRRSRNYRLGNTRATPGDRRPHCARGRYRFHTRDCSCSPSPAS